jgi:hypothetical protein
VGYLVDSFLPLRTFTGITDLQLEHDRWAADVAYPRFHHRVGARVAYAFRVEKTFSAPLPDPLPDTDQHLETRITEKVPRIQPALRGGVTAPIRSLPTIKYR